MRVRCAFPSASADCECAATAASTQVLSDSAGNCKAAKALLERDDDLQGIVYGACVPHCCDLALEDIGKISWVKQIVAASKQVRRAPRPCCIAPLASCTGACDGAI